MKTQIAILAALGLTACGGDGGSGSSSSSSANPQQYAKPGLDVSMTAVSMTSANNLTLSFEKPSDQKRIQQVLIYPIGIRYVVEGNSQIQKADFELVKSEVDLMDLANKGLPLDFLNATTESSLQVHQIRFFLEDADNKVVFEDGSICQLQIPSENQSGLKIVIPGGIELNPQKSYSLQVQFDIDHSLVFPGNGSCLLKPVLKISNIQENVVAPPISDSTTTTTVSTTTSTLVEVTTTTLETTTTTLPDDGGGSDDGSYPDTPQCPHEWTYDGDVMICI